MRLSRLDLVRYGRFSDAALDFKPARPGVPDLHIVYGPNEAGKSTAFSAFLDLLFGIEGSQPRYAFLHPRETMRLGAALEIGGREREVVRLWRPNVLLDSAERPLSDGALDQELAGLTRETYQTMFSLDDDTLEKGGESILASNGNLGQLLFSASAGLAGFSKALVALRGDAETFFKPGGRVHGLAELKKRLVEIKKRKDEIDTLASAYGKLAAHRESLSVMYAAAVSEHTGTVAALERDKRRLTALPVLNELRELRPELLAIPDRPPHPPAWVQAASGMVSADIELATTRAAIEGELARLADDIAALPRDAEAPAIALRLKDLVKSRARHVTAENDLPDRRLRIVAADAEIARILRGLGREGDPAPAHLVLPIATAARLRALMETRSGIDAARDQATAEAASAAAAVVDRARELEEAGGVPTGILAGETQLKSAVLGASTSDAGTRRRLATEALLAAQRSLEDRLTALWPWDGTIDDLIGVLVPEPSDMQAAKAASATAEVDLRRRREEVERLTTEGDGIAATLASLAAAGAPPDDATAALARHARDDAWTSHRGTRGEDTASAFESAMATDDRVVAARLAAATDVAAARQARRSQDINKGATTRAGALLDAAETAALGADAHLNALMAAVSPPLAATLSPAQFEAWLEKRERALEAQRLLRRAESDERSADSDCAALHAALLAAMRLAGMTPKNDAELVVLMADAQQALAAFERRTVGAARLAEARGALESREAKRRQAIAEDAVWQNEWSTVCGATWLTGNDAACDVAVVREALLRLAELAPAIEKRDGLADRVGKMEADQATFVSEIAALASSIGFASESCDPLEIADAIAARVSQATIDEAARSNARKAVEEAERRRDIALEAVDVHERRKTEMTAFFGVESMAEAAVAIQAAERRRELTTRCRALESRLVDELGSGSIDDAIVTLEAVNRAALEASVAELKPLAESQELRVRDLFAERSKAIDALEAVGGDDAPARLEEERRTIILEIEDRAMRHLELRAGIVAAEEALHLYRDRHRSSMMDEASLAFKTISRGAWTGVSAQAAKDAETLVGKVAGGGSKPASAMSKGTRFQLYLALRVAGYRDFVRNRRVVPFIADDIMETFDDERAEEAFRLFADMANVGQVIYLTHHRHLCDIARRACPSVAIHELSIVPQHATVPGETGEYQMTA